MEIQELNTNKEHLKDKLTLIKLLLDVVLVRLVATDAVQTFCRQTCEHKAPQLHLVFKQPVAHGCVQVFDQVLNTPEE